MLASYMSYFLYNSTILSLSPLLYIWEHWTFVFIIKCCISLQTKYYANMLELFIILLCIFLFKQFFFFFIFAMIVKWLLLIYLIMLLIDSQRVRFNFIYIFHNIFFLNLHILSTLRYPVAWEIWHFFSLFPIFTFVYTCLLGCLILFFV